MSTRNGLSPRDREAQLNAQICAAVRDRRLDLGVLQVQLASLLGMAESTFSRYETGQRTMSAAHLCMIAAYLRQPITAFLPPEAGFLVAPETPTGNQEIRRVATLLEAHPRLLPAVLGLIETMLDESHPHAEQDG